MLGFYFPQLDEPKRTDIMVTYCFYHRCPILIGVSYLVTYIPHIKKKKKKKPHSHPQKMILCLPLTCEEKIYTIDIQDNFSTSTSTSTPNNCLTYEATTLFRISHSHRSPWFFGYLSSNATPQVCKYYWRTMVHLARQNKPKSTNPNWYEPCVCGLWSVLF